MDVELKKLLPVLLGIHLVAIPLYTRIDPLLFIVIFLLTLWSALIITKQVKPPPSLVKITALVLSVYILFIAYGTIFGQLAGTSLLLLLSLLKIFEIKSKRDVGVIIFMGYFLIASNFFYTQSPLIAVYVFSVIIYLSAVLIYLNDAQGTLSFTQLIKIASQYVAFAIPFMLILFVLFPRIPGPLWSLPKDANSAKTGLSEELTLENISNLVASGEVAFRVKFENEAPPNNILYWRGPVLSQYDGITWRKNNAPITAQANLRTPATDQSYQYTVTLEPHNKSWLLALEHPTDLSINLQLTRELQVIKNNPVSNVISYTVTSTPTAMNIGLFDEERIRNLLLPVNKNPKTQAFAQSLFQQANGDPRRVVNNALTYFREQPFFYTLSPPALGIENMDSFLFETKKGFCGHYASAFVTLMRGAGIPSRVVTGYQGGELNPIDNYMIIRQSDAHAWAEVWIDSEGWLRVDPTAAVSPERIEAGVTAAGLEENKLPSIIISDNAFLQQSRFFIDSLHNSWNRWIVGYNQKKQQELFNNIGIKDINAGDLVLWLVISMSVAGAILTLFMLRNGTTKNTDKVVFYYNKFCLKFSKAGLIRQQHEGENEFLIRIINKFPSSARAAEIITHSYQQIRYNNQASVRYQKNFIRAVLNFKVVKAS